MLTDDDVALCLRVLEEVAADRGALSAVGADARTRLQKLAGEVARPDLKQRKQLQRALLKKERDERRAHDEDLRAQTGIRTLRAQPVFHAPPPALLAPAPPQEGAAPAAGELHGERKCYVCKRAYTALHGFYDQLCVTCGDLNFQKRAAVADLRGKVAVVTGARVKIGYQAALLLLRSGCAVHALTRFPHDAEARYAREPDCSAWGERLHVHGIDLRHTPSVEEFCRAFEGPLHFQIHNACQTVRRPRDFYAHLLDGERAHLQLHGTELSPTSELFPRGVLDADLQQVDLRTHNSWRLTLDEVPTLELLEVLLVNAAAPFVMAKHLKPQMMRAEGAKHIVMVSAMEGQFYRDFKTDKHPHTNMAKAALNMLVRTSASGYAKDGIYLNAVDTGWVTDEDPAHLAARKVEEHRFSPPLDIVDGAARIVDPIFEGMRTGTHACGFFYKDYAPAPW